MNDRMPQRPVQHDIESASRRAYAAILPDDWVVHDRTEDYGIDLDTEIFIGGAATGLSFCVQVKGKRRARSRPSIQIKWQTLKYWRAQAGPVLVVLWEERTGQIWWQWSHHIDTSRLNSETSLSFTLSFPGDHVWSDSTSEELLAEVRAWRALSNPHAHLPITANLAGTGDVAGVAVGRVMGFLRRQLSEFADILSVRRVRSSEHELSISLDIGSEESVVLLSGGAPATLHNQSLDSLTGRPASEIEDFIESYTSDLMILVAAQFTRAGLLEPAARIAGFAARKASLIYRPEVSSNVVSLLLGQHRVQDAIAVLERLLLAADSDALVAAHLAVRSANELTRDEVSTISEAMAKFAGLEALLSADSDGAPTLYNAAQMLRTIDPERTIELLDEAANVDSGYRERAYWWAEKGGCLFLVGRYAEAAQHYRTSHRMGDPQALPLLADSLMFAGEYGEAIELFRQALGGGAATHPEWRLKSYVLNVVLEATGIRSQHRDSEAAASAFRQDRSPGWLERVIGFDLLYPQALHELGERTTKERAAFAIAGALVDPDHAHAWLAAIRATAADRPDLLEDVGACALRFCGQTILQVLEEEGAASEIFDFVEMLFESVPDDRPAPFVLRQVNAGSASFVSQEIFRGVGYETHGGESPQSSNS